MPRHGNQQRPFRACTGCPSFCARVFSTGETWSPDRRQWAWAGIGCRVVSGAQAQRRRVQRRSLASRTLLQPQLLPEPADLGLAGVVAAAYATQHCRE